MGTKELLKKVRKIEIKTRGMTNQVFSGGYHSAFKGRGMSFSEVREYQYGDDIRKIDWNVTARLNHPYVKVFEEERELVAMFLIDVSDSSVWGTRSQSKNELITEICAVLAFSAIKNNDKVGVIFYSDQIEKFIPPKKGKSHILRIIRELIELKPKSTGTNLNEALRYFNNIMKKRSIAFILSDFVTPDFKDALSIANRRHDIVGLHIYDKHESNIPNIGLARIRDAETGELQWRDFGDKAVRKAYGKQFYENLEKVKRMFVQAGADLVSIRTDDSYITKLMTLFKKRESRR